MTYPPEPYRPPCDDPHPEDTEGTDAPGDEATARPYPWAGRTRAVAAQGGGDEHTSCVALPAMASSVTTARAHARALLAKWGLPALADDVELIVSELVTNAIKATDAVSPHAPYPELYDRLEVICLCVYLRTGEVLVEVWDPRQEPPRPRTASPEDEGGRGLLLVESLAAAWGTRWPKTGGKIVYAVVPLTAREGDGRGPWPPDRPADAGRAVAGPRPP